MKKLLLILALTLSVNAQTYEARLLDRINININAIKVYADAGMMPSSCGKAKVVIADLFTLRPISSNKAMTDKGIKSMTNYLKKCSRVGL